MEAHIQGIFRRHEERLLNSNYPIHVRKAALKISICRTVRAGIRTVGVCNECGSISFAYASCGNRYCPTCGGAATRKWQEKQQSQFLNVKYFHVVFTIPHELNALCLSNQKTIYSILFKASAETVKGFCASKQFLGATPAITSVLHTWGQNIEVHPHIHMAISAGGLTPDMKWVNSKQKFFLPVKKMSVVFRAKFLSLLQAEIPDVDQDLINRCYKKDWVVYCQPPFAGPTGIINYLSLYINRTAISDSRIKSCENGKVTFYYKDYADRDEKGAPKRKTLTLSEKEFIRRYLLHILPKGFTRVRHYGLSASRDKAKRMALCRKLTNTPPPQPPLPPAVPDAYGGRVQTCPYCKKGLLIRPPPDKEKCLCRILMEMGTNDLMRTAS